jgi:hypothetical protein
MRFSDDCPINGVCKRKVFELVSTNTNILLLRIVPDQISFFSFTVSSELIYDSTDPNNLKVICSLLLPELTNEQTICTYNPTTSIISINTFPSVISFFNGKSSAKIYPSAFTVWRRYIDNMPPVAVVQEAFVNVSLSHASSEVIITTNSHFNINSDLVFSFLFKEKLRTVSSFKWIIKRITIDSVEDPLLVDSFNSILIDNVSIIPKERLSPNLLIEYSLNVTFQNEIHSTEVASSQVLISNKNVKLMLLESRSIVFGMGTEIYLLFSLPSTSFDPSLLIVEKDGVSIPSTGFKSEFFPEKSRVIVSFLPDDLSHYTLDFGYNLNLDGQFSYERVILTKAKEILYPQIITQKAFRNTENIWVWTSLGAGHQIKAILYDLPGLMKESETSSVVSTYYQDLGIQGTLGTKKLILVVSRGPLTQLYSFDLEVLSSSPQHQQNVLLQTTYRDGSSLHSDQSPIRIGTFKDQDIVSLNPQSLVHQLFWQSATTRLESSVSSPAVVEPNKFTTSQPLSALVAGNPITTRFSYGYTNQAASENSFQCLLHFFSSPSSSTSVEELSGPASSLLFGIDHSIALGFQYFNVFSPTQSKLILNLKYNVKNSAHSYSPILIPNWTKYGTLLLQPFVFPEVPERPRALPFSISTFDFNSYVESPEKSLSPAAVPASPLPIADFITSSLSALDSITDLDRFLRQANLIVYQLNQDFLTCKHDSVCLAASDVALLSTFRTDLLARFLTFWSTAVPNESSLSPEAFVAKNSLLQGLTLDHRAFANEPMDAVYQSLIAEFSSVLPAVSATLAATVRSSFEFVERLKPLAPVTLNNLNLRVSGLAHVMRHFTSVYSGYATAAAFQSKVNDAYFKLLEMNELRLKRYVYETDTYTFSNEVLLAGGVTLKTPLQPVYSLSFGPNLAIELKNLQFAENKSHFEFGVLMITDEFSAELVQKFQELGIYSELNKSRTTFGFTNDFQVYTPIEENALEINVFRKLSDCIGTPCDLNRKQYNLFGEELILCQCLDSLRANRFAESFPNTNQGNTTSNSTSNETNGSTNTTSNSTSNETNGSTNTTSNSTSNETNGSTNTTSNSTSNETNGTGNSTGNNSNSNSSSQGCCHLEKNKENRCCRNFFAKRPSHCKKCDDKDKKCDDKDKKCDDKDKKCDNKDKKCDDKDKKCDDKDKKCDDKDKKCDDKDKKCDDKDKKCDDKDKKCDDKDKKCDDKDKKCDDKDKKCDDKDKKCDDKDKKCDDKDKKCDDKDKKCDDKDKKCDDKDKKCDDKDKKCDDKDKKCDDKDENSTQEDPSCIDTCCEQIKLEEKARTEAEEKAKKEEEEKAKKAKKEAEEKSSKGLKNEKSGASSAKYKTLSDGVQIEISEQEWKEEQEANQENDRRYQVWLYSSGTVIIAMTVMAITSALLMEKTIKPLSEVTSLVFSSRLMVHEKLVELEQMKKKTTQTSSPGSNSELLSNEGNF